MGTIRVKPRSKLQKKLFDYRPLFFLSFSLKGLTSHVLKQPKREHEAVSGTQNNRLKMKIGLLQNTHYENAEDANEEFDFGEGQEPETGYFDYHGRRIETAGDELEPTEL